MIWKCWLKVAMVIFSILLTIFTLRFPLNSSVLIVSFQLIFVSLFENCKVILQHGRIITLIDSKNITEKNIAPLQKPDRFFNYQLSIPIYRWCLKHLSKKVSFNGESKPSTSCVKCECNFHNVIGICMNFICYYFFFYWNCNLYE